MRRLPPIARSALLAASIAAAISGCEREKKMTPADVQARYQAMRDALDAETPGASLERLQAFQREYNSYLIADSVEAEMAVYRAATRGRYHDARELARDGEFAAAESVLKDLARAPGTPDGESAIKHLEFEFYMEKARWLLVRQRFDESNAVARELLTRDLNRFQVDEVEKILDYAGHGGTAMAMTSAHDARNACRQLIILIANIYINDGTYPPTLSIPELEAREPYSARFISDKLSSIEEYTASQDNYSLVAVSKSGQRFHIVDGQIRD